MGLDDVYSRGILKHRDYFVTWLPGSKYKLGDWTESLDNRKFVDLAGNIRDFGIKLKLSAPHPIGALEWFSASDVSVETSLSGQAAGMPAEADIKVKFKKQNALYVRAGGVVQQTIENMDEVGDALVRLYKKPGNEWRRSYRLITQILTVNDLVVVISNSSNASTTIKATAPVPVAGVPAGTINFTNLVTTSATNVDQYTAGAGATPFVRLARVRDGLFTKADWDNL